jgi:hypothetical protein
VRRRISSAHLIALVALFAALGGGAYAAKLKLKPNSVKTKNIKSKAVTTEKLADGAVTTPKLGDGSVTGAKLAAGSVGAGKIPPTVFQSSGPLSNGWTGTVEFGKDPLGFVHLRGTVSSGTAVIFTLPPGFRPSTGRRFMATSGGATPTPASIDVFDDGSVQWQGTLNTAVGLDVVTFQAEQ